MNPFLRIIKLLKIIFLFFLFSICVKAQNPISVHELETKYNSDWWELGAVLVDTFQVEPFTGVVYLHHVFDDLGPDRKYEVIAFIDHYENGFKDGLSMSFSVNGEITLVENYSKGVNLGIKYYRNYDRLVSSYGDKSGRYIEFWDKYESKNKGKILEYERRTNSLGNVIYEKFLDKDGNEISKEEQKKINNFNY